MINDPFDRAKLFDLLRPPDDMTFDEGIGTTYSLDLPALLVAPLAFTLFDAEDSEGRVQIQSLEVLESLRRYAGKLTVFCQTGRILLPQARFPQFVHLEKAVVQCTVSGGSFHPKFWALRYVGKDGRVVYRVLILTRNLTFDRSWDTVVALEGQLLDRRNAIAKNHPLADFVKALPSFSDEADDAVTARVDRFAGELRKVEFAVPDGFDDVAFWPMGIDGYRRRNPFPQDGRRLLVMSPFLTASRLDDLFNGRSRGVLVSTLPSLADIGRVPPGVERVFTLSDAASPEPEDLESTADYAESNMTGLHAKLYIVDDGHAARILTGSANATQAAFVTNVELLVELVASRRAAGIDAFLGTEQGATRVADVLVPVQMPVEKPSEDQDVSVLRDRVGKACDALAAAALTVVCTANPEHPDLFDVVLECGGTIVLPPGVRVSCSLVTLPPDRGQVLSVGVRAACRLEGLTAVAISRFVTFQVEAGAGERKQAAEFVRKLPLVGGPAEREDLALRAMLTDGRQFVRYLLLLLSDDVEPPTPDGTEHPEGVQHRLTWRPGNGPALLESFLRALDRSPERLDYVQRLVSDLRRSEEGKRLLPPQFDEVWLPIWDKRERRRAWQE